MLATLRGELAGATGLHADVAGRPQAHLQHLEKMRKNLDFSELYDIRAVRILVDSIKGLLHRAGADSQPVAAGAPANLTTTSTSPRPTTTKPAHRR